MKDEANPSSVSLGISPPLIRIEANPPFNIKTPLTITNFSQDKVTLRISLKPFTQKDQEDGAVAFMPYAYPFKISKYVSLSSAEQPIDSLTLAPRQEKKLTLTIDVPREEPPADHYFSIVFLSEGESSQKAVGQEQGVLTARSQIASGIGTNVLLTVGPVEKTTGFIEAFSSPTFVLRGPIAFPLRVKNTSNHLITPRGEILIENMFGQLVGKVELKPVNILKGTARSIPDAFWHEQILAGPYRATLRLSLSEQGPLFTKTTSFTAFPLYGGFVFLIVFALVAILCFRYSTNPKRK